MESNPSQLQVAPRWCRSLLTLGTFTDLKSSKTDKPKKSGNAHGSGHKQEDAVEETRAEEEDSDEEELDEEESDDDESEDDGSEDDGSGDGEPEEPEEEQPARRQEHVEREEGGNITPWRKANRAQGKRALCCKTIGEEIKLLKLLSDDFMSYAILGSTGALSEPHVDCRGDRHGWSFADGPKGLGHLIRIRGVSER